MENLEDRTEEIKKKLTGHTPYYDRDLELPLLCKYASRLKPGQSYLELGTGPGLLNLASGNDRRRRREYLHCGFRRDVRPDHKRKKSRQESL